MAQPVIQTSFHAGEWAPQLNARVDLAKYHAAAALLENFYVDYRGGASTRPGTKYILQSLTSAQTGHSANLAVRLIPFQASFTVNYVLELGNQYIRFFTNGAPVLETGIAITGVTQANPAVVSVANTYSVGDWVFISGVVGMTQLNNRYFIISARTAGTITLSDLFNVAINSTSYTAWSSGGTTQRVYTIQSPYIAADLNLLKFVQNVNTLTICHPSYPPYILTLISATSWTLVAITFGSNLSKPTGVAVATTLGAGAVNYAYVVTTVDQNGQESAPSIVATLANKTDLRTVGGTNTISWTAISGASSYNIYKSEVSYAGAVPTGVQFGFIGNATGISFIDSNIAPDFSDTPPVSQNPFTGAGVSSVLVTNAGAYTTVPGVTIAAPATGITATASAVLSVTVAAVNVSSAGFAIGDAVSSTAIPLVSLIVATIDGTGHILTFQPLTYPGTNRGSISSGGAPANPVSFANPDFTATVTVDLTWGVGSITLINPGSGYTAAPVVTFSAGAATATAFLNSASYVNPSSPAFYQQRLVLGGQTIAPQTFYMSQPGSYYNFDISDPIQADDAITGTLVSFQLNTIKSMTPMPSGLIVLCDRGAWLINGGSSGAAITPIDATAQAQAYNGSSDVAPLVVNYDILYVQAKGAYVRDLTYNFYTNIYTGTDISVLSSHLFFGYTITGWAYAEEPFKVVWAVRNDGVLLSLTYLKEQELIGWAHHTTDGLVKSVCTITETIAEGAVDALYMAVERTINGHTVKYIERMADRFWDTLTEPWCVDSGLQYSGAPAATISGLEHLIGKTVVGLADGLPIGNKVVSASGTITISPAASLVTVGLPFTPKLQTLALDMGEPTVQGKLKKISAVTVRCQTTLGLRIGSTVANAVPMKDLVLGNVGSATGEVVTGLVTADARTLIDPLWQQPGQYYIDQPNPYPASVLGVIPEITVGDTKK